MTLIYWREPLWFLLLLAPLVMLVVQRWRRCQRLAGLIDVELRPWVLAQSDGASKRSATFQRFVVGLLFVTALAGPRTPDYVPQELRRDPDTLIILLDLSASMQARDMAAETGKMSRLQAAAQLVRHWSSTSAGERRIGLLVFAGDAHWLVKPTDDLSLLAHFGSQVEQMRLPTLGNNLAAALELAAGELPPAASTREILVLTDGDIETLQQSKAEAVARRLVAVEGVALRLIGIGGDEAVRLEQQRSIATHLDIQWLSQIATTLETELYLWREAREQSLSDLLELRPPVVAPEHYDQIRWNEWFAFPLIMAMLGLILQLGRGKREPRHE